MRSPSILSFPAALLTTAASFNSLSDGETSGNKNSKKKAKSKQAKVSQMRAELQALLDKPLMMRGISGKYITTRGRVGFVDQLVEGTGESCDDVV